VAWPEISIGDFPPRRDDEPSSLRQDIIDELSDHFACALNRELLKNPDEQTAKQRVLNQFGDPVKIARQLWLDAMKEKIMSQRIMTGISVVAAVCCIAVVGFAWSMMKQSERVNLKLLEHLNQKQTVLAGAPAERMNAISFQLVEQGDDEKAVVGFSGELTKAGDKTDSFSISTVVDDFGELDFGQLPWGRYHLKLSAPWNETCFNREFTTIPGRDYSQTIVCPASAPEDVPVRFHVNWPNKLMPDDWVVLCDFRYPLQGKELVPFTLKSKRSIQNHFWVYDHNLQRAPKGVYLISSDNRASSCPLSSQEDYKNINLEDLKLSSEITMNEGEYHLSVFYLVHKDSLKKLSELNSPQPFGILAFTPEQNPRVRIYPRVRRGTGFSSFVNLFEELKIESPSQKHLKSLYGYAVTDLHGIQLPVPLNFTAAKELPNVWEINIPKMEWTRSDLEAMSN
tara:strand:+ start:82372 stop:83733 length:1362 start_codon:yes stop_codon:yes gene_type:complete